MRNSFSIFSRVFSYIIPILVAFTALLGIRFLEKPKNIHGFQLISSRSFPELNATGYLFEHVKHGCQFLHISTQDTHNFFSTTYRTTSFDNSGVSHVLEHLSLHGSERYPIRSVFTELMKNSLSTFMNAFTSVEWTAYPFSSTNKKDFFNVLDVYLDSTFHPRLDETSFESECHHLEFEQPDDKTTPLRHSGVVYNEMNGEMSKPDTYFSDVLRRNLYPDSSFGFQFGGNPPDIANLTLDKIKEQHNRYYHPCNALFFHYGSFNAYEVMEKINNVIEPFEKSTVSISDKLVDQQRWDKPRYIEKEGPEDDDPSKMRAAMAWIVGDLRNNSEIIDLSMMMILLTDSTLSPLFKGLIETGYGTQFFSTGFSPYIRSPYLSIGLQGIDPNGPQLNTTVMKILNKVYEEGFDTERIQSILHQQEMNQKTVSDSEGIKLWEQIVSSWIHGVDPFDLIDIKWEMERIKGILETQPKYFEILMKKSLIDNPHRLDLTMRGVKGFQENIAIKTKEELEKMKNKMTEEEKDKIVQIAAKIQKATDDPKPLELLPKISIDDISKTAKKVDFEKNGGIFLFEQPTNGIAYIRIKADLPLNRKNIQDIKLLNYVLANVGADDLDEDQFTNKEELYTGGISTSLTIVPSIDNPNDLHAFLILVTSALTKDIPEMIELTKKALTSPHLDNIERIKIILKMKATGFSSKIADNGHSYATRYSESSLTEASALEEMWNGVSFQQKLQADVKKENWEEICARIKSAYKDIFMQSSFTASVHCEKDNQDKIVGQLGDLLLILNSNKETKFKKRNEIKKFMNLQKKNKKTLIEIDSSTFFCSVSMRGPTYSDENAIDRLFAVSLLKTEFLHNLIREKLGAYGVMGSSDLSCGVTSFVSYRDTNPLQVLKAFREAMDLALEKTDEDMIKRTIISLIAKLDHPTAPANVGLNRFINGFTNELAQKIRTKIISMSVDGVKRQISDMKNEEWTSCIVGNSAASTKPDDYKVINAL